MTADNDYSRFNARMNLNSEISKYIKVGINASGYRGVSNDAWNGFVSVYQGVTREKPTNKVYNEDGSYTYSGVDNPVAIQGDKSGFRRNTQQEINLTGHATIQILPELSIKGVYSVRNYTSNQDGFKSISLMVAEAMRMIPVCVKAMINIITTTITQDKS